MKVSNIIAFLVNQKINSITNDGGLSLEEIKQYYTSVYEEIFKQEGIKGLKKVLVSYKDI